jgi:hypothetical protein
LQELLHVCLVGSLKWVISFAYGGMLHVLEQHVVVLHILHQDSTQGIFRAAVCQAVVEQRQARQFYKIRLVLQLASALATLLMWCCQIAAYSKASALQSAVVLDVSATTVVLHSLRSTCGFSCCQLCCAVVAAAVLHWLLRDL